MSIENNPNNSDRYKRRQRMLAYLGIAGFTTGISITLGTIMGVGSPSNESHDIPQVTPATNETVPATAENTGNTAGSVIFMTCVGGLIVAGGTILLRPAAKNAKEYLENPLPPAEIPDGTDSYIDDRFKQIVEPMRGTMTDYGW